MDDHPGNSQEYKNPKEKFKAGDNGGNSPSDKARETEGPWDTIIVNQLPRKFYRCDLIPIFSQYGNIEKIYLNNSPTSRGTKLESFARITFRTEDDALKVWEASRKKLIKYNDHAVMVTLVSRDYSPIENLPDICLREIFNRVNSVKDKLNVEIVCRRWRDHGRCCWSNIREISTFRAGIDVSRMIFSRVANSLENLDFFECDREDIETYALAADHCVGLKRLKCGFSEMPYELCSPHLYTMLQKNENLRRFHFYPYRVENLNMDFMDILPVGLYEIDLRPVPTAVIRSTTALSRLQNLRVLRLWEVTITDPGAFDNLINLEHLRLIDCDLPQASILTILRNNNGLKYLDIATEDLSDEALNCILQLPDLEILAIGSAELTDEHLRTMRSLKALCFSSCYQVTNEGIQNYLDRASDIKHLCISNCPITVELIAIATEWTERTGKFLHLFVDEDLVSQDEDLEWMNTEKFKVSWINEYGVYGRRYDDWFRELVEMEK